MCLEVNLNDLIRMKLPIEQQERSVSQLHHQINNLLLTGYKYVHNIFRKNIYSTVRFTAYREQINGNL